MKVTRTYYYTLILLLTTLFGQLSAQRAVLDTAVMEVGDQIHLTFSIKKDAGKNILFPEFKDTIISDIEILDRSNIDTTKTGELTQSYLITSFEDSIFYLPQFVFLADGDSLKTNALTLQVHYFRPDSAYMASIDTVQPIPLANLKDIEQTPWTFHEFWMKNGTTVWIILLILLLIAAGIYAYIRYKNNKPIFIPPKPKVPAHVTAYADLEALKEKKLWQQDKFKAYHTELTEILRKYLENRYGIPAMEYTANEIITAVNRLDIDKKQKQQIQQIFSLADLVKFAKLKPLSHENDLSMSQAIQFIDATKEEIQTTEEDNQEIKNQEQTTEKINQEND